MTGSVTGLLALWMFYHGSWFYWHWWWYFDGGCADRYFAISSQYWYNWEPRVIMMWMLSSTVAMKVIIMITMPPVMTKFISYSSYVREIICYQICWLRYYILLKFGWQQIGLSPESKFQLKNHCKNGPSSSWIFPCNLGTVTQQPLCSLSGYHTNTIS